MSTHHSEIEPLQGDSTLSLEVGAPIVVVDAGRRIGWTYLLLPFLFAITSLLGGMRLGADDNAFIFLKPALVCLVFAALTMLLFFRSGLVRINEWISEDLPALQNVANALLLLVMLISTTQIYNSLLPDRGLPLWVIGFCFFWTLWTSLFADLSPDRMIKSVGSMFFLAFVAKYLILASLTVSSDGSWFQRLINDPGRSALTYFLDLPRYGSGSGYLQFAALCIYFTCLYLTPSSMKR